VTSELSRRKKENWGFDSVEEQTSRLWRIYMYFCHIDFEFKSKARYSST